MTAIQFLLAQKTSPNIIIEIKKGWLKLSARGKTFRMTAEQVLNHLLPALSGIKPNLLIKVEHCDSSIIRL